MYLTNNPRHSSSSNSAASCTDNLLRWQSEVHSLSVVLHPLRLLIVLHPLKLLIMLHPLRLLVVLHPLRLLIVLHPLSLVLHPLRLLVVLHPLRLKPIASHQPHAAHTHATARRTPTTPCRTHPYPHPTPP